MFASLTRRTAAGETGTVPGSFFSEAAAGLRRRFRSSELWFTGLAVVVGVLAGAATVALEETAQLAQTLLFQLAEGARVTMQPQLSLEQLAVLPFGGLLLLIFSRLVRARRRSLVDAVEANALHGGRMSFTDSLIVAGQTLISNGCGASVGLEAAYAQMGSVFASLGGTQLGLRRGDVRTLVGAGAGASIAAAFGAPLAGSFYAFEIVIGAYMPSAIAPVAAAALAGTATAHMLGSTPYLIPVVAAGGTPSTDYPVYALLGLLLAFLAIGLMRSIATLEAFTRRLPLSAWTRPILGGLLMMPIAAISPQALSSGHSALPVDIVLGGTLQSLALIFVAKCFGSIVSLGFGFRGGLFFASLFIGTLAGHLFAGVLELVAGYAVVEPAEAALVGMAALAVAVIGGPITMAMLVMEATQRLGLAGAVITASLVAGTMVRTLFGYSFSTWRLHLRGETIRSARDVGWVRLLTAGRMMRKQTGNTPAALTVAEFRRRYPLGSTQRVVVTDAMERYAGIVLTATAYAEGTDPASEVADLAILQGIVLTPEMNIVEVMKRFDEAEADELAVVAADKTVLGLLSESFVRKRYAEEIEKAQRELFGEGERS
ncbi:chloride channel protein [Mangrovibrevibacter kandeliae]|uniref:chloride channel protein n=1 Tax=Mangrovibrevibacter kandeliae TaxID=2968473 RepID=UPI002119AC56|nr:chloride channel protein [Aurantimonas sp. CSK15Z-1]